MASQNLLDIAYIDDDLGYAETVVDFLTEYLGVEVQATADPEEFFRWLETRNVLVAVIDQRMPLMSGVEILREIERREIPVRRVMLTGEASRSEVADAFRENLSEYVEKREVTERLPTVLTKQMLRQQTDLARLRAPRDQHLTIRAKAKGLFSRSNIMYKAVSGPRVIKRDFADEEEYKAYGYVEVGWKNTAKVSAEWTRRTELSTEVEAEGKQTLGLTTKSIVEAHSQIESRIRSMTKGTVEWTAKRGAEVQREIEGPPQPVNPDELHVIARSFESAPAYDVYETVWQALCEACDHHHVLVSHTYMSRGQVSLRQVDRRSDGDRQVKETLTIDMTAMGDAVWSP